MKSRHGVSIAKQRGVVLIVALIFMLVIMILGLAGSSQSLTELHMAGNNMQYESNLELAEGTLKQAYSSMMQGVFASQTFTTAGSNGYYQFNSSAQPIWQQNLNTVSFWSDTTKTITGYAGTPVNTSVTSSYVVESIPIACKRGTNCGNQQNYGQQGVHNSYRVTARVSGSNGANPVVLQAIFSQ
ncbi:PilX N-terminal domain-containing pilus assembly protein [Chromobacterium sp. IIBBL 290-4]|uniref:pilus assembly PilX family protein n=1 Tax=Chromobacterium sp. IIBBL 290-4 TaxID=2953890 RepID=UPI0020B6D14A|nr:PilX N-terminal domain-containing pilus assembly protein [Chromobacterium sp. IIBBL 290-4]UTH76166.1 PilX N-terminal domain-containing pilus assembly protein [Chromobacterium sp. IIBBL 290-4]